MSGGRYDGVQFGFYQIIEDIRTVVYNNDSTEKDEWGFDLGKHLPADIIAKFTETADLLERCEEMATRIDYLLSGDDGVDSFRRRWKEEGLEDE